MKLNSFLLLFVSCAGISSAQITTSLLPVQQTFVALEQMLNIKAENLTAEAITAEILVEIEYEGKGRVYSIHNPRYRFNPGVNLLSAFNFEPGTARYFNADFSKYVQNSGYLPPGKYNVCIHVSRFNQSINEGNKCAVLSLRPMSPPRLVFPAHNTLVSTGTPDFHWLPPMPAIPPGIKLSYNFYLVEIHDNQPAGTALNANRHLILGRGINDNFMMYPVQQSQLEEGKRYAWQVEALVEGLFNLRSEPWEFSIQETDTGFNETFNPDLYYEPRQSLNVDYAFAPGDLKVKYQLRNISDLNIYDTRKKQVAGMDDIVIEEVSSDRLIIGFMNIKSFRHDQIYILEIKDRYQRVQQLKFKYINPGKVKK